MRVNVDTIAFQDARFASLGIELGVPFEYAHDVGLARMIRVWAYCTDRGRTTLQAREIDGMLGPGAHLRLVVVGLARDVDGEYYIAGTKGRVEWLERKRAGAAKARDLRSADDGSDVSLDIKPDHPPIILEEGVGGSSLSDVSGSLALDHGAPAPRPDPALDVYALYPRKEGKTPGLKRLRPQLVKAADVEAAKLAAQNYARHVAGREIQHVKLFSSWVSEWRDWITPESAPARASPGRGDPPVVDTSRIRVRLWAEQGEQP